MPTSKARGWFVEEAMVIGEGSSLFQSIVGPVNRTSDRQAGSRCGASPISQKKVTRPSFRTEVSLHIVSVRLFLPAHWREYTAGSSSRTHKDTPPNHPMRPVILLSAQLRSALPRSVRRDLNSKLFARFKTTQNPIPPPKPSAPFIKRKEPVAPRNPQASPTKHAKLTFRKGIAPPLSCQDKETIVLIRYL